MTKIMIAPLSQIRQFEQAVAGNAKLSRHISIDGVEYPNTDNEAIALFSFKRTDESTQSVFIKSMRDTYKGCTIR